MEITQALLNEILSYDPETGELKWKARAEKHFSDSKGRTALHACRNWNARRSGKPALFNIGKHGYHRGTVFRKGLLAHRVIWLMVMGEWPEYIDHINGCRTDNKLCNLRSVTMTENNMNRAISSRNSCGVTGVYWCKHHNCWIAEIKLSGKKKNLGYFHSKKEASAARKSAETKLGFHSNHGRAQVAY